MLIKLPKEIENRIWAKEYAEELSQLPIEELIDITLTDQIPDDFDGCWTTRGYWKSIISEIVLKNRVLRKD